jgi:hypothetical protein
LRMRNRRHMGIKGFQAERWRPKRARVHTKRTRFAIVQAGSSRPRPPQAA